MTRAILARSASVFASRSIIEAMIRIWYGVMPYFGALVSMFSWPSTLSICPSIRPSTWAGVSPLDT